MGSPAALVLLPRRGVVRPLAEIVVSRAASALLSPMQDSGVPARRPRDGTGAEALPEKERTLLKQEGHQQDTLQMEERR